MTKEQFEAILDGCCGKLTQEARTSGFKTAAQFENRVREALDELTADDSTGSIDFSPQPKHFQTSQ